MDRQYKQMCDRTESVSKEHIIQKQDTQFHLNNQQSMENEFFQSLDCSKISFFNRSDSKKSEIPPKQRLKILINKKRQTLAALQTLQHEEKKIKANINPVRITSKQQKQKRKQSREDNKQLIQDLIHQSKLFEKNIQDKIKNVEELKKQEQMKIREEQANNLIMLRKDRQIKAQERMKKMKQRQIIREQSKKQSKERTKQLQGRSYIFQKFKTVGSQPESNKVSPIKKEIASINQILEHQKRYKSLTKEDNQQRKNKIQSFRKQFNKRSTKKYPEGRIASILKEQKQQEKIKQLQKQAFAQRYLNRVSEYGKIVRELYHPRIKQRQRTEASESKGTTGLRRQKQSKSVEQLKQLGDSYLAYNKIHRAKKSLDINFSDKFHKQSNKESRIKYKDYLKQIKPRIISQNFSSKFQNILREQKSPQRIFKLRTLLRNEQIKHPQPNEDKLKQLTNAKLAIIDYLL